MMIELVEIMGLDSVVTQEVGAAIVSVAFIVLVWIAFKRDDER